MQVQERIRQQHEKHMREKVLDTLLAAAGVLAQRPLVWAAILAVVCLQEGARNCRRLKPWRNALSDVGWRCLRIIVAMIAGAGTGRLEPWHMVLTTIATHQLLSWEGGVLLLNHRLQGRIRRLKVLAAQVSQNSAQMEGVHSISEQKESKD